MPYAGHPADPTTGLPLPPPAGQTFKLLVGTLVGLAVAGGLSIGLAKSIAASARQDPAAIAGARLYANTCKVCHGAKGEGGVGKPLTGPFTTKASDADLAAFIKVGRTVDDPANTTKTAMPPKGGNADLTDTEIEQIVAAIRGFDDKAPGVAAAGSAGETVKKAFRGFLFLIVLGTVWCISGNARGGL